MHAVLSPPRLTNSRRCLTLNTFPVWHWIRFLLIFLLLCQCLISHFSFSQGKHHATCTTHLLMFWYSMRVKWKSAGLTWNLYCLFLKDLSGEALSCLIVRLSISQGLQPLSAGQIDRYLDFFCPSLWRLPAFLEYVPLLEKGYWFCWAPGLSPYSYSNFMSVQDEVYIW